MIVRVVSCACNPESVESTLSMQFVPAGAWRVPGQMDVDLLGYYPLGEYGGTDISGKENHAIPFLEEPADLDSGILCEKAEVMDGQQYYTLPFDLQSSVTVSLWLKVDKTRREQTILSIGDDIRFGLSWMLEPIIWLNERKENEDVISGDPIQQNTWTHLTFARNGGEFQIYVNGVKINLFHDGESSKHPISNVETLPGPAILGRYRGGGELYGSFQDMIIRGTALDSRDLYSEYRSYCEPLLEVA